MKRTFFTLFEKIIELMNTAVVVVISLALVGFLWGIVKILFNPENEIVKKEGRNFMVYGIFILFVMTSVWAIVKVIRKTFIGI